jgi:hypothetical protein
MLLALSGTLFSQSAWIRKIDLDRFDSPSGLIKGDAEAFYFLHREEDGNGGPVIQNLTKMSITGSELWNLEFENYPFNVFEGPIAKLSNDDVLVCLSFEDSSSSMNHVYRINPDGDTKWIVDFPFIVHDEIDYAFQFYKIIHISPNDIRLFFRMNYYWDFDPPSAKNGYISLDSLGQERERVYFDTNGEYHWPYNIIQAQDSHFVKVYRPTLGQIELLLRYDLIDKENNEIWSFEIGPQDEGGGGPVCTDANSNVYFTWNHDTTGNGSVSHQLPSIYSLNKFGELRWSKHFGEDRGIPIFYDIISSTDGRVIACGQEGNTMLSGGNYRTGWIASIDTSGNKLWERRYVLDEAGEPGNNFYFEIEADDGGLILVGNIYYETGGSDVYILKTDYYGCLIEDCDIYNFISFFTSTKALTEDNNLFYYYLVNSNLNIVSKVSSSYGYIYYEMSSLSGSVILRGRIKDFDTPISVSGLLPGIYFIRIHDDFGKTYDILKFFNPG